MASQQISQSRLLYRSLKTGIFNSVLVPYPISNRAYLKQAEERFAKKVFTWVAVSWGIFFVIKIFAGDLQKARPEPWIIFRVSAAASAFLALFIVKRSSRPNLFHGVLPAIMYAGGCAAMSYLLPSMRTFWTAIFAATFLAPLSRSLISAIISAGIVISASFLAWAGPIEPLLALNDVMLATLLIAATHATKSLFVYGKYNELLASEAARVSIEKQMSILDQVSKFVPTVVENKIRDLIKEGEDVETAVAQLLECKQRDVTILYSDFRNYSRKSEDLEFVKGELKSSQSNISDLIEQNSGIPQQAGDSALGLFTFESEIRNTLRALYCAIQGNIYEQQQKKLGGKDFANRYFIVTKGVGAVGNMGSSQHREITVTGKPANLAARIDELSKNQFVRNRLESTTSILVDFTTMKFLRTLGEDFGAAELDLRKMGIEIRTYSEEIRIFSIVANEDAVNIICNLGQSVGLNFQTPYVHSRAA